MIFKKKILFINLFIVTLFIIGSLNFRPVQAETVQEILDEIARIEAQLEILRDQVKDVQSPPSACIGITFERNLKEGMSGADVKCLQALLNSDLTTQVALIGPGSLGNETNYFGSLTTLALIKFQEKYAAEILTPVNLTKGTGFAGPKTIAKLNSLLAQIISEASETKKPENLPTVSLSANFTSVAPGQPVSLNWTSSNTTNCSGTNFITNDKTSGTAVVAPTTTTTYFMSCTGPEGSATGSVTVTVTGSTPSGGASGAGADGRQQAPPPVPPPPGCFLAGTKITMADGTYKNIEEVKVGDLVRYFDFKERMVKTTKVTKTRVYSPEKMSADFYLVINNKLKVTPNQPLDSPDGKLILANDLKVGDKLQGEEGVVEIFSIERVQRRVTTYYIETESGHYFVDGISDALKVFKQIEYLFASISSVLVKIVKIIENMK